MEIRVNKSESRKQRMANLGEEVLNKRHELIDEFLKAYLAYLPDEAIEKIKSGERLDNLHLVEQRTDTGYKFYFEYNG